jgi:hypothetical protein
MTAEDDLRNTYLTDPQASPSADVQDVERRLAPLRFELRQRPLDLPLRSARPRYRTIRTFARLAAAVAIFTLAAAAYLSWRLSWTDGAPWKAAIDTGASGSVTTALDVNRPLTLTSTSTARVNIARIGTMRVEPGSAITLAETTSARHRVVLNHGAVSVRIWAPPGIFAFRTPSGSVRDLGCIFDLSVDEAGTSRVHVDTGWVQMDNDYGESLVPAGASAEMRRLSRPGVPIYDDSSSEFAAAVRAAQDAGDAAEHRELDVILRTARRHDVLTLLMLANVSPEDVKNVLLTRAAALWPPPSGVSIDAILAGDRDQLWKWHGALDVPPVKSWWRNWRDAFR